MSRSTQLFKNGSIVEGVWVIERGEGHGINVDVERELQEGVDMVINYGKDRSYDKK